MSDFSFPNKNDAFSTRVTYAVAAEFIYRIDAYLQHEHEHEKKLEGGFLPVATLTVAMQCAEEAMGWLHGLESDGANHADPSWGKFIRNPEAVWPTCKEFASIVDGAAGAVNCMRQEEPPEPTHASPRKAQLLATLGKEFFTRFHALCECVIEDAQDNVVVPWEVGVVRACVGAAMGMLHELKEATWAEGAEVPARAILPLRDHVISYRLGCTGPSAVRLMDEVYQAVVDAVMEEA